MADMNASRTGQINQAGDEGALFLKLFAGETISAFAENNVALGRTKVRTISGGKSAQFPVFGKGGTQNHVVGTQIVGTKVHQGEKIIVIDDVLIADRFIANIDEAKSHFEVRSEYTKDVGRALAQAMDINILRTSVLNSRLGATVTGGFGGTKLTVAAVDTSADALIAAAFDAAQAMDEKDIPAADRFLFVRPDQYYNLVNSGSRAIHRDYNDNNGSIAEGTIYRLAGFQIVKTNNLPNTNVTTGTAAYRGDFSKTVALAQHKEAVGTVKLMDLGLEMEYKIEYQGTLIVAKYAVGHGSLRPECSVEIALPA